MKHHVTPTLHTRVCVHLRVWFPRQRKSPPWLVALARLGQCLESVASLELKDLPWGLKAKRKAEEIPSTAQNELLFGGAGGVGRWGGGYSAALALWPYRATAFFLDIYSLDECKVQNLMDAFQACPTDVRQNVFLSALFVSHVG